MSFQALAAPEKPLSMTFKPFKTPLSLELDKKALLRATDPEIASKIRLKRHEEPSKTQEDFVFKKSWDPVHKWDPNQKSAQKPWSPDLDTMAGAALRARTLLPFQPTWGIGFSKSVDTQER